MVVAKGMESKRYLIINTRKDMRNTVVKEVEENSQGTKMTVQTMLL